MSKSVKRAHSPTAQPLPPITVLDIGWSDGVSHFQGAVNAPTEEQLKPNSEDGVYYAEVEHYSKKELHWLERLAGLTIEQKDPALKNLVGTRLYLNKLPENYKLFEVGYTSTNCGVLMADLFRPRATRNAATPTCTATLKVLVNVSDLPKSFCRIFCGSLQMSQRTRQTVAVTSAKAGLSGRELARRLLQLHRLLSLQRRMAKL